LVQDINATDLPPGGSPDNSDCFYLPGGVYTRPALKRAFSPGTLSGNPTIQSVKEFPSASGEYLTMFLDSNGLLYSNDPMQGSLVNVIDTVTPGVQFKAENYGGKQWYAFFSAQESGIFSSNPYVGVDVPRYFDGSNVYRVTSDAPGISPEFFNLNTSALDLVASPISGTIGISGVISEGEQTGNIPNPSGEASILQSGVASNNVQPVASVSFPFPLAVTSGNTVLVAIEAIDEDIYSVTDSQGNTYGQVAYVKTNNVTNAIWISSGVTGGPVTVTVTLTNGLLNQVTAIACHEIAGLVTATSPVNGNGANPLVDRGQGVTTFQSGQVNTSYANDWIFSFVFTDIDPLQGEQLYGPGGYTVGVDQTYYDPIGNVLRISTAYESVVSTGSYNPAWSSNVPGGNGWQGLTIGLALNPGGGGGGIVTYWTELVYTCTEDVPADWLGSSITVTGFSGTNSSIANRTGIITEINGEQFTLAVVTTSYVSLSAGSALATGTIASSSGNYMVRQSNIMTAYLGSSLPSSAFLQSGFWVQIINADSSLINGPNWTISQLIRDTTGLVTVTVQAQLTNLPVGTSLYVNPASATFTGTATATVGLPTLTWSSGQNFDPSWSGQPITYAGNSYVVQSVQSGTILTLTTNVVSGIGSGFSITVDYFSAGYQTVTKVLSVSGGYSTFTFQSLDTIPFNNTSLGGVVYQTWSPSFGTYGNAAQITNVGYDPFNGWYFQFFQLGPDAVLNSSSDMGIPQASIQAQAAPGTRSGVCMFLSSDGAITAPSVPVSLAISGGSSLIQAQNIPIGPPGTAQRIIALTPAEGANFYYITPTIVPETGISSSAVAATGTIIEDNVTTSQVLDFSDAQLTASTANQIDVMGNNLFNQVVLAPCLGVIEYQGRLGWWGEINNVKNFGNMGFDGGFVAPTGTLAVINGSSVATYESGAAFVASWVGSQIIINGISYTVSSVGSGTLTLAANFQGTSGTYSFTSLSPSGVLPPFWTSAGDGFGSLAPASSPDFGFVYVMQGGHNNLIQQSCARDAYGAQILLPSTQYTMRFKLGYAGPFAPTGACIIDIYSPSLSQVFAQASFTIANVKQNGATWVSKGFNAKTPSAIPADCVLRLYLSNVPSGTTVIADELEIIYSDYPVSFDQMRLSYYQNPFGYDSITGVLSVDPAESLTGVFRQRGYLYILSESSLFQSQNNGSGEPSTWSVIQYAASCGCSGPNAVDFAEDVAYWAGRYGGRAFVGDPTCKKITQELAPTWESISWNYQTMIWVKNDPVNRILYFGVPINQASSPNVVLSMSYRLSDAAVNVPDPIHVSQYSGRLICTDLGRRWSPWHLTMNCADMCTRMGFTFNTSGNPGLARTLVMGAGNGQVPNEGTGFGNLYTLDTFNYPPTNPNSTVWNCTDDDFGQINSFYTTYFFFSPDVEQNPLLSLHRKLFNYLAVHATGVGLLKVTPLIDSLVQPAPSKKGGQLPLSMTPLSLVDPNFDLEWHPLVRGNRVAWKVQPVALPNTTAQAMAVTHLIVSGRRELIFPTRGTVFGY
jgi:hypothetical protein